MNPPARHPLLGHCERPAVVAGAVAGTQDLDEFSARLRTRGPRVDRAAGLGQAMTNGPWAGGPSRGLLAEHTRRQAMTQNPPLVADFMTIDPVVVRPDASIEEATRLLAVFDITGLPVVDDVGRPVGVISQTDLLAIGSVIGRLIRSNPTGLRVGELMSTPALTVPIIATMSEAARIMHDARVHRLVAIDDEGRAVGVLSASDFVTLYAEHEPILGRPA